VNMSLRPEEIIAIIKAQIEDHENKLEESDIGTVLTVGDGIARIYGLTEAVNGELLEFTNGSLGMVLNLEQETVGAVIFGSEVGIKEQDQVRRTGKVVEVPVGETLLGRVIDPLGRPLDGKGPVLTELSRPIENKAPGVTERQPVKEPLQTGLKSIDSMIPIGRGQRELIIGDRQTGKTAIAVDTILNQKGKDVICIYVAIGQKASTVAQIVDTLEKEGALDYSIIVTATASDPAPLQYIAPYAGCAIGEHFMYQGRSVLVVYDDLSKHAVAYRAMALLLRRPPGREAFPGDIFYLHSRLLERAAKLSEEKGGGSLTALPIVETQAGDVSAYIPTNVISITDGQIYLESDLFFSGFRPAVNVGLSVSRVGGNAQIKGMKKVAGHLRLDLAQYRELAAFAQFGSELDKTTQSRLTRGEKVMEILKQPQYSPMRVADQILSIYAAVNGYLDEIPVKEVKRFESEFLRFVNNMYPGVLKSIDETKDLTSENEKALQEALNEFKARFIAG
jgi:F-type H+-transporting ATPase subunit alpha